MAGDFKPAFVGTQQAGEDAQQRGLADAVVAADQQRFAGFDLEIQRPEQPFLVARERKAMHGEQGR